MRTRSIRVTCDSPARGPFSARNTRVYDAETGEDISSLVSRVAIDLDASNSKAVAAVLTVYSPVLDVVCEAELTEQTTLTCYTDDIVSLDQTIALLSERRATLAGR
jgi:hypothetical protein